MATIYELAVERMDPLEIDNHESDLYLKKTGISEKLVANYEHKENVTTFPELETGVLWYDIPFAFDPFWKDKDS